MVDLIERQIFEMVKPWNGRSWLTFKIPPLIGDTSSNQTMNMDEKEAQDLLDEIFTEFTLRHADLDFSIYFAVKDRNDAKLLTLNMLIESAKAGRWLYD